ncbi:MAG: invasion associated locus B family protein [Hyphomicrobiaceae bacterium]|nr:invasion associated locus B family protein [Hyphomicrobiaceae bacterium]
MIAQFHQNSRPESRSRFRTILACMLAACFLAAIPQSPGAFAQTKPKEKFGDWEVNCGKPPGARQQRCALVQSVIDEERANVGLRVVFLLTSDGRKVLRVVAPLGVLLPFGLGLRIDEEPIGDKPLPFIRCRPMGCISEIVVKNALLDKLKAGKTALFIIVETKEEGRAIPVSLSGFSKGLERLASLAKTN